VDIAAFVGACNVRDPDAVAALPGRGQALELRGVSLFATEGDLILEERVVRDTGALMASAGVLPG